MHIPMRLEAHGGGEHGGRRHFSFAGRSAAALAPGRGAHPLNPGAHTLDTAGAASKARETR